MSTNEEPERMRERCRKKYSDMTADEQKVAKIISNTFKCIQIKLKLKLLVSFLKIINSELFNNR